MITITHPESELIHNAIEMITIMDNPVEFVDDRIRDCTISEHYESLMYWAKVKEWVKHFIVIQN